MNFDEDTIEISLLGGGAGYGESIVIHLGDNNWIIVDSAENPKTKDSLPILYLKELGVDIKNHVKLVVSTHWHDDHIRLMTDVVEHCKNAVFCFSSALAQKNFLILAEAAEEYGMNRYGVSETLRVFKKLSSEKRSPMACSEDKCIFEYAFRKPLKATVHSLSPSNDSVQKFREFSEKLTSAVAINSSKKLPSLKPNHVSVVLAVRIGEEEVLLGADLETTTSETTGWTAVLNTRNRTKKSTVYKVAHHGSITGYRSEVYEDLLTSKNKRIAIMTPYSKLSNKLPTKEGVDKIFSHINREKAFITSNPNINRRPKKRSRPWVNKTLSDLGVKVSELPFDYGQIRLRKKIASSPMSDWEIEILKKATLLDNI